MKTIYTLIISLILTTSIIAQAPNRFSYQAVVRNSASELVTNRQVGMQISILQGSATRTPVYTETHSPTTNANGLVSIEIGGGTTTDDFSIIDWSTGPYFLQTETDPDGGTNYSITGITQLLSVPYALHAKTAENSLNESDPEFSAWDKDFSDLTNAPDVTTQPDFFIGPGAGENTLPDKENMAIGDSALFTNTKGYNNTSIGHKSLYSNTEGYMNTVLGKSAMRDNTTGYKNTALGYLSLLYNISGSQNTGLGHQTLYKNSTGMSNTAAGFRALNRNTTGSSNIAIGQYSLYKNTTKSNLVAIGDSALYNNGTDATHIHRAINNTAVGSKTLFANTTGSGNTANGHQALYNNTTGYSNTAAGAKALFLNTTGYQNTATGYRSLYSNTQGVSNVAYGYYALNKNTTGYANVAVGNNALGSNQTGRQNTAIGTGTLFLNTGNNNTALGYQAGNTATGNGNIFLGYKAGYNERGNNKLYINNAEGTPLIYGDFETKTVTINGDLNGPDSGSADMKAYIYGLVTKAGNSVSAASSKGFTVKKYATGIYEVLFSGTNKPTSTSSYIVLATAEMEVAGDYNFAAVMKKTNGFLVFIKNVEKDFHTNGRFSFVVYKK